MNSYFTVQVNFYFTVHLHPVIIGIDVATGGSRPLFWLGSVGIFVQKPLRNFSEGEAIGRIGTKVIFMDKNVSRAH